MTDNDGYKGLEDVFCKAFAQAAQGKGAERHANGRGFEDQPIARITDDLGLGFPLGQVSKKVQEANGMVSRGQHEAAEHELLGAINYLASAILTIRRWSRARVADDAEKVSTLRQWASEGRDARDEMEMAIEARRREARHE